MCLFTHGQRVQREGKLGTIICVFGMDIRWIHNWKRPSYAEGWSEKACHYPELYKVLWDDGREQVYLPHGISAA